MVRHLDINDFRAIRKVLEPEDFAGGSEGPDPEPTNLVSEDAWDRIVLFPDDVAIRTSNYHGDWLDFLVEQRKAWSEAIGWTEDEVYETMVDSMDEWDAATFNAAHGYYRQAIASLRNVLELVTIGTYCQLCSKSTDFRQWREGKTQIKFDVACAGLHGAATVQVLNTHLTSTVQDSLFDKKSPTHQAGWARRLYEELSFYAHSRATYTNADLWKSNGPIFVPKSFGLAMRMYTQTAALCYVTIKLARTAFTLPDPAADLFSLDMLKDVPIATEAVRYLFTQAQRQ